METPQPAPYVADPGFAALMEETKKQNEAAVAARVAGDTADVTARYGAPTAGDSAAIMARYASLLTLANRGGVTGQPPQIGAGALGAF